MNKYGFIKTGQTKMVDVDVNLSVPSSNYFISINMLFEFTPLGQIIPTRIDTLPYKLSPFTTFKEDSTSVLDVIKFVLNFYNIIAVTSYYGFIK